MPDPIRAAGVSLRYVAALLRFSAHRALTGAALILLLAWPLCAQRKPNVVFLLADDLGWSDLGVYGADLHQTPNLDRFAASGVRFTSAYAASPVCSPTRASILTGKQPARLHMTIWREAAQHPPLDRKVLPPRAMDHLPHSEVTLAEVFKQAGYVTAHVGKWHLGTAEHYPRTQGFDYNIGGTLWGAPQTFFYPYSGDRYFREPRYVPHLEDGQPGEYLTDRLTDEALKILERHKDQPLYLQLWYHSVHTPIEGKPDIAERYQKKIKSGMNHRNAHYAAMVESLDQNVGRVLAKLDELGLADNTVVVFSSDNGGFINPWQGEAVTNNAPLRSGKGSLYEGGVRVPTIIRWPGVTPAGGVSDTPVCSTDFFPTLLSVTGLDSSVRTDGVNLAPLLRNPAAKLTREALYFHYPHYYATTTPVSSVRVGDWKLMEYYEDGRLELYNLAEDPGEAHDLAKARPADASNLQKRLHLWLDEVGAQLPTRNP
jgi:arylsulfatase A-like enzyme